MDYQHHIVTAAAATLFFAVACGSDDPLLPGEIDSSGRLDAGAPEIVFDATIEPDLRVDATTDAAQITCATGLRPEGGLCVSAVPQDPEFDDPAQWEVFGGARVESGLQLDRDSICSVGGSGASTTLDLGPYDEVGALVVTIDLRFDICDDPGIRPCEPSSILYFRIGESVIQVPSPFGLDQPERSVSFCLPSTAYNGAQTAAVWFREFDNDACTDRDGRTIAESIESIRIAKADPSVCPEPGVFADPGFEQNFEGDEPRGWDVRTGGTGQITIGGTEDDLETVLSLNTGCSNAQMQQTVRVPAPSNPANGVALRFDHRVRAQTQLQVRVGPLQRYVVGQASGPRPICLPSYLWGRAEGLLFRVTGTTDCSEVLDYEAVIDDLELVELAECGPSGSLRNGSFGGDLLASWNVSTSGNDATVVRDTGDFASLDANATCGAATIEQWVSPRVEDNAVRFRYRATAGGAHAATLRNFGAPVVESTLLAPAIEWTEIVECLPGEPRLPINLSFTEFAASMTCGVATSTGLEIDDVELFDAPACR